MTHRATPNSIALRAALATERFLFSPADADFAFFSIGMVLQNPTRPPRPTLEGVQAAEGDAGN